MQATVTITPQSAALADLQIHVVLTNGGSAPAQVNTLFFPIPSVSFDVTDAHGAAVPKGPPPVPPLDDGKAVQTLKPGESVAFDYNASSLFPTGVAPGTYSIRFHGYSPNTTPDQITSDWVTFTVK